MSGKPSLRPDGKHRQGNVERTSGLAARVKYCNTLPDIPFDPKFLKYPFDSNRFVQYQSTTLEKAHKTELHTDPGIGVVIDLINPDTYKVDPKFILDPADEELLQEEVQLPTDSKRSKQHSLNVSWLRRSEYISQYFNRYGAKSTNVETRLGAGAKDLLKEDDIYKDRDGQLAAIEKTFTDAKEKIVKHPSKPNVVPVEVLPVYPDFKMWMHPSAQVIFDTDPALVGKSSSEQMEEMSQAMIRGMVDEEGDQFVAYFLPTDETRQKRKDDIVEGLEYEPDSTYDYKLAREYNWNVKNKASKGYEENYYFVVRENGVYYNELETRVRLSKRRAKGGAGVQAPTNAILEVTHRSLNDQEVKAQEVRKMQLEPAEAEYEEDEDDKDDEKGTEENTEINADDKQAGSIKSLSGDEAASHDDENDKDASDESSSDEDQIVDENEEIFGSGSDSDI